MLHCASILRCQTQRVALDLFSNTRHQMSGSRREFKYYPVLAFPPHAAAPYKLPFLSMAKRPVGQPPSDSPVKL